ncbi:MAG: DUF4352 domain-containing protein [Lachnospiraceae bacterium]|nr:DUF4352 domain-containing protein [Lachnospiraceae bacterium]
MKKKSLVLAGLIVCLAFSACSSGKSGGTKGDDKAAEDTQQTEADAGSEEEGQEEADAANGEESEAAEDTQDESDKKDEAGDGEEADGGEEADNEEEEQKEETVYNIGETAALNDWEITVTDMKIAESIAADYGSFSPNDEGNKYVQVFVTATNNGKQAEDFLPIVGMGDDVNAKVVFGDGYEFVSTNLLGYGNDMHGSKVNPLSSQSGEIAFEVPEAVHASEDELQIHFLAGNDVIKFKIR